MIKIVLKNGALLEKPKVIIDNNIVGSVSSSTFHTMVPALMDNLFNWINKVKEDVNPLILSSIFHYEFVSIHPFSDENGRTARLWQTLILAHWKELDLQRMEFGK